MLAIIPLHRLVVLIMALSWHFHLFVIGSCVDIIEVYLASFCLFELSGMPSPNNISFVIYLLSIILVLTRLFILTEAGHLATNPSDDRNIEPIDPVRDFHQTEAIKLSARQNAGPSSVEIDPLNDFRQTQSNPPQPYRQNSDYGANSAPTQSDLSQVPVQRDVSPEASGTTSEPSTSSIEPEKKPFKEELMVGSLHSIVHLFVLDK